jgi:hypothetical protein
VKDLRVVAARKAKKIMMIQALAVSLFRGLRWL